MALVVLVTLGGWLAAVFLADRQPVSLPGRETIGHAAEPGADPHSAVASAADSGGTSA